MLLRAKLDPPLGRSFIQQIFVWLYIYFVLFWYFNFSGLKWNESRFKWKVLKSLFCVNSGSNSASKMKQNSLSIFRASITLAIPNIAMTPALEDVQQALNRAVECIVNVTKGVRQWSGELLSKVRVGWRNYVIWKLLLLQMGLSWKISFYVVEKDAWEKNGCFAK